MENEDEKRLFFGLCVDAPWPPVYPQGRILDETMRHVTLAFLGNMPYPLLEKALLDFPKPSYTIGPVGKVDHLLFLPKYKPRVVAHHIEWIDDEDKVVKHQKQILDWLEGLGFSTDRRPFLPHVTIARAPFEESAWEKTFEPLPLITTGIHLYESIGNLRYLSIWHLPLLPPFEEVEHTADIAFLIRGTSFKDLYIHGALSLSFKYPPLIGFLQNTHFDNLDAVVKGLNQMITTCDFEMGCPFKAVSYHGNCQKAPQLLWEMIVDV